MKYCGYCGSAIADNEKICPVCKKEQDSMSYTEAITMVKNGEQKGFEYLYNTTYARNKWELSKILGNEDDAEDVLQNAYIKMMGKIDMLQDPEKFPGWFGRMATNMAIDLYRAQHPKRKDSADENDTYRRIFSFYICFKYGFSGFLS